MGGLPTEGDGEGLDVLRDVCRCGFGGMARYFMSMLVYVAPRNISVCVCLCSCAVCRKGGNEGISVAMRCFIEYTPPVRWCGVGFGLGDVGVSLRANAQPCDVNPQAFRAYMCAYVGCLFGYISVGVVEVI